ncbi:hypothetical protein [Sphingobium sp. MP9-4]|uniref:hypothetical protein n=1 Tax=Sphingobium sp. MP9-4 TaxID=1761936 RepID=UPI0010CA919A|nr:hypothetical protein [Sphingobium sp. MP9-4]
MTYTSSHAPKRAIRNILRNFERLNEIENADVPVEQLVKAMRADLQNTRADLSDAEIERRIDRRLERGMQPTTSKPLPRPVPVKPSAKKGARKKGGKR